MRLFGEDTVKINGSEVGLDCHRIGLDVLPMRLERVRGAIQIQTVYLERLIFLTNRKILGCRWKECLDQLMLLDDIFRALLFVP